MKNMHIKPWTYTTLDLTPVQEAAIRAFIEHHGRHGWKQKLLARWFDGWGKYREHGEPYVAGCQQIRNIFGPSWLKKFTLTED